MSLPGLVVEAPLAAVRDALRTTFAAAVAARPAELTTVRLELAGQPIRLRIAGRKMASRIVPALTHLIAGDGVAYTGGGNDGVSSGAPAEAELTVCVWDTAGSGTPLPPLPDRVLRPGRIAAHPLREAGILVSLRLWERDLNLLDERTGEGYYCVADAEAIQPWEVAHPLTTMLGWWASRSRRYLVHSASVGVEHGALLLAGAPGAGKSTTALACLHAGMRFLGDDAVLVGSDPAEVTSVFCSGRADVELLRRRADVLPELPVPSGDKAAAFFGRERMTRALPLRAIVLPTVVPGGVSQLTATTPARALLTLAPEPSIHQRHVGEAPLATIAELVRTLPLRSLEVGDDLERVPGLLADLLAGTGP